MNSEFLKYYLENELYLENPPLEMTKFIEFCNKRGVNINEDILEKLEKNKKFYPLFRINNPYNPINEQFVELSFEFKEHPNFIELYENDDIYLPDSKSFEDYKKFIDSKTSSYKISSYYSTFQIYHLESILNEENIEKNYILIIDLLIAIQIYSPYGRSNLREIGLKTDTDYFYKKLKEFDLNKILKILNTNENLLYKTYYEISSKLKGLLGSNEMIQLWKNISWNKKDECIGNTRLGIEYLQWAMMLKKCIESYLKHEIFDVDEIDDWRKIPEKIPSKEEGINLRACRNEKYINKINDEYEFKLNRKKLYYLANSLTLDYHPRVIIFVEGYTEEIMIPKFFEFCGYNFKDVGFEIVNISGISNFYSGTINVKDENNKKYIKNIVSNFKNLIEFNLELYQIIPFFIGDNENNIKNQLKNGIIFDLKRLFKSIDKRPFNEIKEEYFNNNENVNNKIIDDLTWIWKYDFELDNFSADELKEAINSVCNKKYTLNDIEKIYNSCKEGNKKGIKSLGKIVDNNKIEINNKAFEILKKKYKEGKIKDINERPIFKLIEKLFSILDNNYQPNNTKQSMENKKWIYIHIGKNENIFKY